MVRLESRWDLAVRRGRRCSNSASHPGQLVPYLFGRMDVIGVNGFAIHLLLSVRLGNFAHRWHVGRQTLVVLRVSWNDATSLICREWDIETWVRLLSGESVLWCDMHDWKSFGHMVRYWRVRKSHVLAIFRASGISQRISITLQTRSQVVGKYNRLVYGQWYKSSVFNHGPVNIPDRHSGVCWG